MTESYFTCTTEADRNSDRASGERTHAPPGNTLVHGISPSPSTESELLLGLLSHS